MRVKKRRLDMYNPLTLGQVRRLLTTAAASDSFEEVSRIQCRLIDGVKGIEYPIPIGKEISRRVHILSELYIDTWNNERVSLPNKAAEIYSIMNGDQT